MRKKSIKNKFKKVFSKVLQDKRKCSKITFRKVYTGLFSDFPVDFCEI
jgi:hypothetical protein